MSSLVKCLVRPSVYSDGVLFKITLWELFLYFGC